jgi:C-terminal processing protease CtpA/Prc
MKLKILILLFFISLNSCVSVKKHNKQISRLHTVNDLKNDVDDLYLDLQKYHPRLYQYKSKEVLDFKFDSLKESINARMNSTDFYKKIVPVIAQMGHGHTSLNPPRKKSTKEERRLSRKKKNDFTTLEFEYLNKQLFLKSVQKSDSILLNAQVLKVNNELITDIDEKYRKMFSSDGFNITFYDKVIGKRFKSLYYKDNGGLLDTVQLTLQTKDSLFVKTFKTVLKDSIAKKKKIETKVDSIKIKPSKAEKKAKKIAWRKKRKYNKIHGYNYLEKNFRRNLNFIGKDSTIAYMKIRGFSNGDYKSFYEQTFAKLKTKKTENLIIDLRYNGGGRAVEINNLYSYLTDKEFQFFVKSEVNTRIPVLKSIFTNTTPIFAKTLAGIASPFIATYRAVKIKKENNQLYLNYRNKIQKPNSLNFKGKIYVLINGYTFSASSVLSTHLNATKRATFVGEETGGAYNGTVAGFIREHNLPNSKVKISFGMINLETPYKQKPDGYGIKPDKEILPTLEDRRNKVDPELDWVLKEIESKKNLKSDK